MASEVDIANLALSKLGEARIISLTDNNKPARAMLARFETLRDAELTDGAWRFAAKRVTLPALATAPTWGYSTAYQLPNDHLRPLQVGDMAVNIETIGVYYSASTSYNPTEGPFEIVGAEIHTDQSAPLNFEYIRRVTDTGLFPAPFVESLAARLAADAAIELTQSNSIREDAARQHMMALRTAKRLNMLWRAPQRRTSTPWMLSRF